MRAATYWLMMRAAPRTRVVHHEEVGGFASVDVPHAREQHADDGLLVADHGEQVVRAGGELVARHGSADEGVATCRLRGEELDELFLREVSVELTA